MNKRGMFIFFVLLSYLRTGYPFMEIECTLMPFERANSQSVTTDWSGYAAATRLDGDPSGNETVSSISGSWIVPTLLPSAGFSFTSIWVGIDGYSSATVEQIGTSHDWDGFFQNNYAWFEIYPNISYTILGFPVDIGDLITAKVTYEGFDLFQLSIINQTQGVSTTIPSIFTMCPGALRNSAEWVVEAPSNPLGIIAPLSDFQITSFRNCSATINGVTGSILNEHWMTDEMALVNASGDIIAQPFPLTENGSSFMVTWKKAN